MLDLFHVIMITWSRQYVCQTTREKYLKIMYLSNNKPLQEKAINGSFLSSFLQTFARKCWKQMLNRVQGKGHEFDLGQ